MKKSIFIFITFYFLNSNAQGYKTDSIKIKHFKFEAGLLIPVGNFKSKLGVSLQYGFWYRTIIEHKDIAEVGLNIIVPTIEESFLYQGEDTLYETKPKFITLMLGCRFNKQYSCYILNNKVAIGWASGYGLSLFSFEDKENNSPSTEYYTDSDGQKILKINTRTKALACVYLSQGIGINTKRLDFLFNFNFTPYSLYSNRVNKNFGNSSFSILMSCKI